MTRFPAICVLGAGCLLAVAEPVLAECLDVPAPGVYWRRCLLDGQDLRSVDLTGATLRDASFKRSDLSDAVLVEADARRAKFVSTNLPNADLTGASLVGTDLTNARLFGADLSQADLTGARLSDTDLLKAVLGGATWIDGKTICSEDSVGQCHRSASPGNISEVEPRS